MPRSRSKKRASASSITRMMRNVSLNARGRARSRSRSRGMRDGRARSKSRSGTGPRNATSLSAGEVVMQHTELLKTLTTATGTVSYVLKMHPRSDDIEAGHLKAMAKIYRRYKYTQLSFEYTGTVGSTVGGVFAMGYAYDDVAASKQLSWPFITACSPNKQTAVYKKISMTIPVGKMLPQRWLETDGGGEASPGVLLLRADSEGTVEVGMVRVTYTVHFAGPNV